MATNLIPQTRFDLAEILRRHDSIPKAAQEVVDILGLEGEKFKSVCTQLSKISEQLKKDRKSLDSLKGEWWDTPIPWSPTVRPRKKRSLDNETIQIDISHERRKPLSELTVKALRTRLASLLNLINVLATKEETDMKTIASYALQLVSNDVYDKKIPIICKEIIRSGTFSNPLSQMPLSKSVFLLDHLQIGKRKYNELRRLCKTENFIFHTYNDISEYRSQVVLSNELKFISSSVDEDSIGIAISYKVLLHHTITRLLESIDESEFVYPLTVKISDGLDGSGSQKIYNQQHGSTNFDTKNYILFAFKLLSLKDYSGKLLWENETPNSPFGVRPVSLICQKENEKNVKFILDTIINPEVSLIEKDGISLPNGQVIVQIMRTMLDGKMSAILSGAGGASCQLCTTHFNELKDLDLIRAGYPINRSIKDAKLIFETVDREEFLSLPSNERFGLTHEPISSIDIVSASPLHSYTCVFRWFMQLIYHLQSGTHKWAPTSKRIQDSMKFVREFLYEKTGMKIDQVTSAGGTTSTGNMAR